MDLGIKTINKNSPVPLYYQLKEILLEDITDEGVGSPFPTERELCEHFGISRPTVRQAINELVSEGYLTRFKGKGTFVASPKIKQDFLLILESFNDEMRKKGLVPTTKVLECTVVAANELVAKMLRISIGDEVVQLRRLRFTDGQPIVIVVTHLPCALVRDITTKDLASNSMYDILARDFNLKIDHAIRTLEATVAGEYEAKLLGVKLGAPVQFIETVTYLVDETPIEFSHAFYRGDLNKFSFELHKTS